MMYSFNFFYRVQKKSSSMTTINHRGLYSCNTGSKRWKANSVLRRASAEKLAQRGGGGGGGARRSCRTLTGGGGGLAHLFFTLSRKKTLGGGGGVLRTFSLPCAEKT